MPKEFTSAPEIEAIAEKLIEILKPELEGFEIRFVLSSENPKKDGCDLMNERKTERDKQLDELKKVMLTKDIFDAYHQNDVQRMERLEKMVQQILENQNRP